MCAFDSAVLAKALSLLFWSAFPDGKTSARVDAIGRPATGMGESRR